MKLLRFRVTDFRSVTDSGWIDVEDVTALIGTNESGKTNLLIPLWKLKPAKGGEIKPTADYPRKRYNEIRVMKQKPQFIHAVFELGPKTVEQLVGLTGAPAEHLATAEVSRDFDGKYKVGFPDAPAARFAPRTEIVAALDGAALEIRAATPLKAEESLKPSMLAAIETAKAALTADEEQVDEDTLSEVAAALASVNLGSPAKRSTIAPAFGRLTDVVGEWTARLEAPGPADSSDATTLIVKRIPRFVYYSNYGNLDSEIYLPHVIDNMERDDLGTKEEAKARTLKVLFDFVRLSPKEILELGRDFQPPHNRPSQEPTDEEIAEINERKRERSILMQSASTELTQKFRGWWKQGDYRFRFEADGNHFRIWVSDDRRPEEIELENRSTGLQWFLSFFLVFLVESGDEHSGAMLLLDEPGLSLHPLAQKDLSAFFNSLASENQLIYTTHSPFLVDPDRLDRVKAVFVNRDGSTGVSSDLRAGERAAGGTPQSSSIYPVYAALNLTASDTLLLGCDVTIVEGTSDQIYLSAIKNFLIGAGRIKPKREMVFLPAGGVKGVQAIGSVVTGAREALPAVLLDGDGAGRDFATKLRNALYQGEGERIHLVTDFIPLAEAEIEDLVPPDVMYGVVSRWLREPDQPFEEVAREGTPVVDQIEEYARTHEITLRSPGWKVELARLVRPRLQALSTTRYPEWLDRWTALFEAIIP